MTTFGPHKTTLYMSADAFSAKLKTSVELLQTTVASHRVKCRMVYILSNRRRLKRNEVSATFIIFEKKY